MTKKGGKKEGIGRKRTDGTEWKKVRLAEGQRMEGSSERRKVG
jgi:hypothetical protein